MELKNLLVKLILTIWPVVVIAFAVFYRKKQSSDNPLTGGPISWPKSFWLSYTIQTWFFLPFIFLIPADVPVFLKTIITFHLASWWGRGLLEMVMIYKWFNWSPRYGISHDIFHIIGLSAMLYIFRNDVSSVAFSTQGLLVLTYILMLFFTTSAEISFAMLFMRLRTLQEQTENIYFASDDPKWIFVNRYTLVIVVITFIHLFFQSWYAWKYF